MRVPAAYSAAEIDRMRLAIIAINAWRWRKSRCCPEEAERLAIAENQLRTYMAQGSEPRELEALLAEIRVKEE